MVREELFIFTSYQSGSQVRGGQVQSRPICGLPSADPFVDHPTGPEMGHQSQVRKWVLTARPPVHRQPVLGVAANENDELKACGELARACEGLRSAWEGWGGLGRAWEGLGRLGRAWDGLGTLGMLGRAWEGLGALGRAWDGLGKFGRGLGKLGKAWESLGALGTA